MELKDQVRERTQNKRQYAYNVGIIKVFHQIEDLVPQNKDQKHKQIALSCQQKKKKKVIPLPSCLYTCTYLEARVHLLAPNSHPFWK